MSFLAMVKYFRPRQNKKEDRNNSNPVYHQCNFYKREGILEIKLSRDVNAAFLLSKMSNKQYNIQLLCVHSHKDSSIILSFCRWAKLPPIIGTPTLVQFTPRERGELTAKNQDCPFMEFGEILLGKPHYCVVTLPSYSSSNKEREQQSEHQERPHDIFLFI